ncbi:22949_t:CDS:2 [Dentiscutata erythropus]|uniref:22949_t:CDS:1 n=1 Tax=Dentiscutata erythropus TaxID=1348616 RepID=A0A9N9EYD9_9GLOM|nr:22949_t:CDS:2 [Dentiscutata erythropus]
MDSLTISLFGKTCGIGIYPTSGFYCVESQSSVGSPFGNAYMLITIGYAISLVMVIPLGILELVDNIGVQIASFITLLFIIIIWIITFIIHGLSSDLVPFVGNDQSQVIGTVLYNYAFITTVPTWIHETGRNVPIRKVIWISILISTIMYVSLGVLGGMAYVMDSKSNIVAVIDQSNQRTVVSLITTYLFPVAALVTSIPVFTIVVRLNLMNNNNFSKRNAILLSSFVPWVIILPFQTGVWLNAFMNWSSLIFSTISNFVLPFYLYYLNHKQGSIKDDKPVTDDDLSVKIITHEDKNNNLSFPIVIYSSTPDISPKTLSVSDENDSNDKDYLTPNIRTSDSLRRRRSRSPSKSRSRSRSSSKISLEIYNANSHNSSKIEVEGSFNLVVVNENALCDSPTLKTSQPTNIISDEKHKTDIIDNLSVKISSTKSDEIDNSKFIAFPGLKPIYGIWIAAFCGIAAILLASTMIFYDFVELGMGNNVFG